jgi:hypothetical protein
MDRFELSGGSGRSEEDATPEQEQPPEERLGTGSRVTQYLSTVPSSAEAGDTIDRIGTHVSSIVRAAEEAAQQIRAEARQEAERLLEDARREAATRTEAARRHASMTMSEADTFRAEAEDWSKETRESAEKYAADRRAEAEAEARSVVSTAEREAAAAGKDAERRQQALRMDISLAEERLRQLAVGLHELAARLDELIATPAGVSAVGDGGAGEAESLMEALAIERETHEAPLA